MSRATYNNRNDEEEGGGEFAMQILYSVIVLRVWRFWQEWDKDNSVGFFFENETNEDETKFDGYAITLGNLWVV